MNRTLKTELAEAARALGFIRMGVATAGTSPDADKMRQWVDAGHHADLTWYEDTVEVRADPRHPGMLATAQSVVVLITPYAQEALSTPAGKIASYAIGRDYHNVLMKKLRKLEKLLRDAGYATRCAVDSKPVLERAWAERAGVGFIGKNSCLIVPGVGSKVFISALISEAPLPADAPMSRRCGECTLCLDACPTRAFNGPYSLKTERCISYLTIEKKGAIDPELRAGVGEWLFGCDDCQDVCPYNQTRYQTPIDSRFEPDPRWQRLTTERVMALNEGEFASLAEGSPLKRAKLVGIKRNATIVARNRHNSSSGG